MNAKLGPEDGYRPIIGRESLHNTYQTIMKQDSWTLQSAEILLSVPTHFPRGDIHKQTWLSPDGRTYNQIYHT